MKNLHLFVSLLIVVPIALVYGNTSLLEKYFDIQVASTDLSNMLKAVMCLYLGISVFLLLGIFRNGYWKAATQLTIVFTLSLAIGRSISMITDGLPTTGFILAVVIEFAIGFFSIYQLKKYAR